MKLGRSWRFAQRSARTIWPWSCPSIRFVAQPAALKRSIWSPVSARVARPSMVVSLSSNSTVSLASFSRPARCAASWLTPSIRQPSPAITQVRWSTSSLAVAGREAALGHRHADRGGEALAERPGGGLDAGRVAVLRVAGGQRAPLPEALDLVHRHGREAGQMQQAVEQHRAVAGREHEAVAVGPVRVGGVELKEPGPEHRRDVGHAQAACPGGRTSPGGRRPSKARGWRWPSSGVGRTSLSGGRWAGTASHVGPSRVKQAASANLATHSYRSRCDA